MHKCKCLQMDATWRCTQHSNDCYSIFGVNSEHLNLSTHFGKNIYPPNSAGNIGWVEA